MNIDTGELFENLEDAMKEALSQGMSEIEAEFQITALDETDYNKLKGMNRSERRLWAKTHKRRR